MTDFETTVPAQGDQHKAEVRAQQREFQEHFGDFKSRHVMSFWVGPAPQGEWIGLYFELENGEKVRVSIPLPMWQIFGNELVLAMMSGEDLAQLAYAPTEGST